MVGKTHGRLAGVTRLVSLFADDVALIFVMFWVLPRLGISVPLPILLAVAAFLFITDVIMAPFVIKGLEKAPTSGPEALIGLRGVVVRELNPEGYVKVAGELWRAVGYRGKSIKVGEGVEVVEVKGSLLVVDTSEELS